MFAKTKATWKIHAEQGHFSLKLMFNANNGFMRNIEIDPISILKGGNNYLMDQVNEVINQYNKLYNQESNQSEDWII